MALDTKNPVPFDSMAEAEPRDGADNRNGVGAGSSPATAVGGGGGSSSKATTSSSIATEFAMTEERRRFEVELKPGETTFVSWKKLIKDSSKKPHQPPPSVPSAAATTAAAVALPSHPGRADPGQPVGEVKDAPPSSRFSAVIEKIERLYMGKQSSDEEEELDDAPDDDQYDTEDSFIDDADLDEYFQVDKSTTKHTGFFINRGKLEHTNEPVPSPKSQPKKRKRKELKNAPGETDGEHVPNKHAKVADARMKAAKESAPLAENKSSNTSRNSLATGEHYQNGKSQNLNVPMGHKTKKSADSKTKFQRSSPSKIQARDTPLVLREANDTEKQKPGFPQSRDSSNKMKVERDPFDATHQASAKAHQRDKHGNSELPDLNLSVGKHPLQTANSPTTPSSRVKDGSNVRPKGTMLERAIRDLEKIVAESRPPTAEVQDTDNAFQAVKRRLPREVKQKLAKVARLAQSGQGKIPDDLIQRLMSILGHIVQLRTLKRNLKEMVELGLSAKQEKDNKVQQIKEEVINMIETRGPWFNSKESGQHDGASDDFREGVISKEKGGSEGKCSMDDALEDKICDLYDLYVEGMDEEKAPRIRKLYVELAELWPNGSMDNHGIKNAVYRSKERRRALNSQRKDQENVKRRKLSSASKTDDTLRGEGSSVAQPRVKQESSNRVLALPSRPISSLTSPKPHLATLGQHSLDRPKQEKVKLNSSMFLEEARKTMDGILLKKKLTKKSGSDVGEISSRPDKNFPQQGKERHKTHKHTSSNTNKTSLDHPNREQPS